MNTKIFRLWFSFVLIASIGFMGCGGGSDEVTEDTEDTAEGEPVKIGLAGPLTGAYGAFGEQLWNGAELAVANINADGGINGRPIELIKGDDQCEPKQAVAVANRLVDQDEVIAVVGHFCSSTTIPASEVYDQAGILNITPGSTNPTVTDRGLQTVFRICGRDDQQGLVAGTFIHQEFNPSRAVILHDKDTYGQGLADETQKTLESLGVEIVLYEGLTRGEKDFRALVTKVRESKPDIVYFGGLHAEAGPLVRQMREEGLTDVPFMSGDGIADKAFVSAAGGPEFTKEVYFTSVAEPSKNPDAADDAMQVIDQFEEQGKDSGGFTLYSYAAVQVLAQALGDADFDIDIATEDLKSNTYQTVLGDRSFDDKGDAVPSIFSIFSWDGDSYDTFKYQIEN